MQEVEELYGLYGRSVYAYLLRISGSHELAAECTQETFLRLFSARHSFRGQARVQTWLYGIARNVYSDEMRRRSKRGHPSISEVVEEPATGHGDPLGQVIAQENRSELQAILAGLPDTYREVLVLREYEGLPYEEIAALLGRTTNWVRVTFFRARTKFRELYQERRGE
jgi:RNA polymerase sigma factor (sigma-70 family)